MSALRIDLDEALNEYEFTVECSYCRYDRSNMTGNVSKLVLTKDKLGRQRKTYQLEDMHQL